MEKRKSTEYNIKMKVSEQTKLEFQKQFHNSKTKTYNDFVLNLISKESALPDQINVEIKESDLVNSKLTIRIKNTEKLYLMNTFNNSTEKRLGAFILKCVMKAPIRVENVIRMGESVSHELRYIGNNLNQIALRANQIGMVDKETLRLLEDIKRELSILTSRP